MASRNDPGPYDYLAAAAPDEEVFTLVARDPMMPPLVDLWAAMRDHDWPRAAEAFADLLKVSQARPLEDRAKVDEAYRCAERAAAWRRRNRPTTFERVMESPRPAAPAPVGAAVVAGDREMEDDGFVTVHASPPRYRPPRSPAGDDGAATVEPGRQQAAVRSAD